MVLCVVEVSSIAAAPPGAEERRSDEDAEETARWIAEQSEVAKERLAKRLEEEWAMGPPDPEAMRRQAGGGGGSDDAGAEDEEEEDDAKWRVQWIAKQNDLARERLKKRLEEERAAGSRDPEAAKRQATAFEPEAEPEGDAWLEEQNRHAEERLKKRSEEQWAAGPVDPEAARRQAAAFESAPGDRRMNAELRAASQLGCAGRGVQRPAPAPGQVIKIRTSRTNINYYN